MCVDETVKDRQLNVCMQMVCFFRHQTQTSVLQPPQNTLILPETLAKISNSHTEIWQVFLSASYLSQDLNKDEHGLQRYQEYFIQCEIIVQVRKENTVRNGSGLYEYYYCLGFAFMEFKRNMSLLLRDMSWGSLF